MNIKAKLAVFVSAVVVIMLTLNAFYSYYLSRNVLRSEAEQKMLDIAGHIGSMINSSEAAYMGMEDQLGRRLRDVAIAARSQLPSDYRNIDDSELSSLAERLGVAHISLWAKQPDSDIVVVRSSDPGELGLSADREDYRYEALLQLLAGEPVTAGDGLKLEHYYSGLLNAGSSDSAGLYKQGDYYDGTTNYILTPSIGAGDLLDFNETNGTQRLILELMSGNPDVLGIAGIKPADFGKGSAISDNASIAVTDFASGSLLFGSFRYFNDEDRTDVMKAVMTGHVVTVQQNWGEQKVIKSFVPVSKGDIYVIGVVFDLESIEAKLNKQLMQQVMTSLLLTGLTVVATYFVVGAILRPLNRIVGKVNDISHGRFGDSLQVRQKDELGQLASRINVMSLNLQNYMRQLTETAEELGSTKEYLESFFNHTSDAIHVIDLDGYVTYVNGAFEAMYGFSEQEIIGERLDDIPDTYQEEFESIRRSILNGESLTDYETVRRMKDGSHIELSVTVSSIRDKGGGIIAIAFISRNIMARKQTEELLRRSEKLSVVGQLAAGVAHEIRNPLTTLRGFVQLIRRNGSLAASHVDIMLSELDRINFIVSEFLVFAKPQAVRYDIVPIKDILSDMFMLMDSQASLNNIRLSIDQADEVGPVLCEVNQLKQVFINILKNAMEAMPGGGELRIELAEEDGSAVIRFIDQGSGIPKEDLDRLGEPFFTKKESGTGLGLMVSQKIIAGHKGTMRFDSTVGEGTTVEIRLPLCKQEEGLPDQPEAG